MLTNDAFSFATIRSSDNCIRSIVTAAIPTAFSMRMVMVRREPCIAVQHAA